MLQTNARSANDRVTKSIDQMFANSAYETTTDTERMFNKAFVNQFGNIALIIGLVVGAAFSTILMIVGNTMIMAVRERTREIGVLKALGFPQSRILRLILGESLFLALLGGFVGIGIAALIVMNLRENLMTFMPGMTFSPSILPVAMVMMLGLGILTGLPPAVSATRLKIAAALGRNKA
jgi:putative ABC transport system permease protein